MIELVFVLLGMMTAFFVIVGGMFWAFGFIADAFNPAFADFEVQTDPYRHDD